MDGGGGGGDNAKIPLLMDCISSFKLLSFVVTLSDASSSSFVMLSLSSLDATCGLSTDSFEFTSNIALIAVSDNCFAFSLRNCWHRGQKFMSSDMHFKWKECEHPSNIIQASSPVTVQLGKSHLFLSFGGLVLQWPSGSIFSSSLPPQIVLGDLPLHSFLGHWSLHFLGVWLFLQICLLIFLHT